MTDEREKHLGFMARRRPAGLDKDALEWALAEIERLRALTAAAQVRERAECAVLDSYAAENQRFSDEIERLQGVIRKAHYACTKSSLTADERVFDATAILSAALGIMPIYGATEDHGPIIATTEPEDQGPDVLGIKKGEE